MVMNLLNKSQRMEEGKKNKILDSILNRKSEVTEDTPETSVKFELNFIKDSMRVFEDQLKINDSDVAKEIRQLILNENYLDFNRLVLSKIELMRT